MNGIFILYIQYIIHFKNIADIETLRVLISIKKKLKCTFTLLCSKPINFRVYASEKLLY